MPKRGKVLLLVPVILLIAGLVGIAFKDREPKYVGRTLSEWAEVTKTNEIGGMVGLRQIGTNALPWVLKWLQEERQPWKDKIFYSVHRLPHFIRPRSLSRWVSNDSRTDHTYYAFVVLAALGQDAGSIAPELLRLSQDPSRPGTAERAVEALGCIGTNGLPQLLEILRSPKHPHRADAATIIGELLQDEPGAASAVPVLVECLAERDANLVLQASDALAFAPRTVDLSPAIRALKNNLGSSDEFIRMSATNTLNSLAPHVLTNSTPP